MLFCGPACQAARDPERTPETGAWRVDNPPQGVPSMDGILLDERSQSGPMTATVAEPQGVAARRS
jgi:hypothetical protein